MIMASNAISSWQIENKKAERVTDFIFLGSKINEDGDCSYKYERHLLLGRKATTNLDSVLKSRDITRFRNSYAVSLLRIDLKKQQPNQNTKNKNLVSPSKAFQRFSTGIITWSRASPRYCIHTSNVKAPLLLFFYYY